MSEERDILAEQIAYYRARAGEYDQWFLRQGRFDYGPEHNARWFDEVRQLERALERFAPTGRVLEIACGTGQWTERLLRYADTITALDSSPEVIALNRERMEAARSKVGGDRRAADIRYVGTDLFAWQPDGQYDVAFFSFWLSHVPPERFEAFWEIVRAALAPGGRAFFIDSAYEPTGTAADHKLEGQDATAMTRRLNDGREFRIVKIFYRPADLESRLAALGWTATVHATPTFFIYGEARFRGQVTGNRGQGAEA